MSNYQKDKIYMVTYAITYTKEIRASSREEARHLASVFLDRERDKNLFSRSSIKCIEVV